jgi:hypothetical protein
MVTRVLTYEEMIVERGIMIPMRDGVRLATDIYRPAMNGKSTAKRFPVILERTPYDKTAVSRSEITAKTPTPLSRAEVAQYFVCRGYIVAYQDCRGRYASEGAFTKYLNEGEDGYNTIVWLAKQPWCDGKIGTMGLSYAAHTQVALGCLNPPGLSCQFVDSGGFSNAYQGGIRQGGAFELRQATWAIKEARLSPEVQSDGIKRAALESVNVRDWFTRLPWKPGHSPLQWVPEYEAYLFEQWSHGVFDEFWKQLGLYAEGFYGDYANVPIVLMSSWYDPYARTAIANYLSLSRIKKGPVKLILGPWTHGGRSVTFAGDIDFGRGSIVDGNLAVDYLELRL